MVYGREAVYGNVEAAATPASAPIAAGNDAEQRGQQSSTAPLLRELSGLSSGGNLGWSRTRPWDFSGAAHPTKLLEEFRQRLTAHNFDNTVLSRDLTKVEMMKDVDVYVEPEEAAEADQVGGMSWAEAQNTFLGR